MEWLGIDFVRLEEQLNQLLYDPEIRKRRSALADYVIEKLQCGIDNELAEFGINDSVRQEFLTAPTVRTTQLFRIIRQNQARLGLSGRMFREFGMRAKIDRESGLDFLSEVLLERRKIDFQKNAGISAKVWLNFLHCRTITKEEVLEKICRQLSLNDTERLEFNRRMIRRVFYVDEALREEVHRLRKATGMTVSEFLVYAWISTDAWEAFYTTQRQEETGVAQEERKKTSQETLLKLVIGYGLDENAAKDFMHAAHSMFVVRRDLVVLAAIRCRYQQPMKMQEILEFFSKGPSGQLYYTNLYARSI